MNPFITMHACFQLPELFYQIKILDLIVSSRAPKINRFHSMVVDQDGFWFRCDFTYDDCSTMDLQIKGLKEQEQMKVRSMLR